MKRSWRRTRHEIVSIEAVNPENFLAVQTKLTFKCTECGALGGQYFTASLKEMEKKRHYLMNGRLCDCKPKHEEHSILTQ